MPDLAADQLNQTQFASLCDELMGLAKTPTLTRIREALIRHGVKSPTASDGQPSLESARTFRAGSFARHVERIRATSETRAQLCAAAGAGVHPLDAVEEVLSCELQDHLLHAEGGIDLKFVIGQVMKLRASLTMRAEERRKQSEANDKRQIAERRCLVLEQQLAMAQRDVAAEVIAGLPSFRGIAESGDDAATKLEKVRHRLFGDAPSGLPTLAQLDRHAEEAPA